MQTLNVGAGQTDEEYKAAEDHRRADLLADSRSDANYFFWAAGLAALASGLFPVQVNFLVNIGAFDLVRFYGRGAGHPLAFDGVVGGGWPSFAAPLKRVPHSFAFFAKEPALSLSKGWARCCRRLSGFA
jgi:hypothetical protein